MDQSSQQGAKTYDMGMIRNKLDPAEMIRQQMDRCQVKMAELDTGGFRSAVEGLMMYCEALSDEEYLKAVEKTKGELTVILNLKRDRGGRVKQESAEKEEFNTYKKIFNLCIRLIQRKGMLFRQTMEEVIE